MIIISLINYCSNLDIDEELDSINLVQPFVAMFGEDLINLNETMVVVNIPNLVTAIHSCLVTYYVFNIVYPQQTKSICLFLETVYCLKSARHPQDFLNSLSKVNV